MSNSVATQPAAPDSKRAEPDMNAAATTATLCQVYATERTVHPSAVDDLEQFTYTTIKVPSMEELFRHYPNAEYCFDPHDPKRVIITRTSSRTIENRHWYIFVAKPTFVERIVNALFQ
jgi:hypothetical protein